MVEQCFAWRRSRTPVHGHNRRQHWARAWHGSVNADSHTVPFPCCSHAVPLLFLCRFKGRFTHTMPFPCRFPAATLPLPCHFPRVLCFTLATASEIGILLITNFLELGVASRQYAVNMSSPCRRDPAMALRWHGRGTAWHVWIKHGRTV
jgi:hypothetical protein